MHIITDQDWIKKYFHHRDGNSSRIKWTISVIVASRYLEFNLTNIDMDPTPGHDLILEWLKKNCQSKFKISSPWIAFESETDAMLFKLTFG